MHALTFISQIYDLIRLIKLFSFYNSSKIRRGIQGGAIGFHDKTGGQFLFITLLRHIHHKGTFTYISKAIVFQLLHHIRYIWLYIALLLPQIEFHIQPAIICLQVRNRYIQNMLPQRPVSPMPLLQLCSGFLCLFQIILVLLRVTAGIRIDFLQITNSKGSLLRIPAGVAVVKIGKFWVTPLHLSDNKPDLQAPVPKMNVSQYFIPHIAADPLHALTDNGRTQMPYMKRLCHIRSAIIDHNGLRTLRHFQTEIFVRIHRRGLSRQQLSADCNIDKAGIHRLNLLKNPLAHQTCRHFTGNGNGGFLIFFGRCHSAITLVLAQVRTIAVCDKSVLFAISCLYKAL